MTVLWISAMAPPVPPHPALRARIAGLCHLARAAAVAWAAWGLVWLVWNLSDPAAIMAAFSRAVGADLGEMSTGQFAATCAVGACE